MSLEKLLKHNQLKSHETSQEEIHNLLQVVSRDLEDALIPELSNDRRFATAYNAALQLSKIVLACKGFRATGQGQHKTSFEAISIVIGESVYDTADYFDFCRRKRNTLNYDMAYLVNEAEVKELIVKVEEFRDTVLSWIENDYKEFL